MRLAIPVLSMGAVAFGFSAVFTKLCAFPPEAIGSIRMLLAAALLLPLGLRKQPRPVPIRQYLGIALPGLLLGLHFQLWVAGIKLTTAAAGTFLYAVNPVLFALAERMLYRRRLPPATLPCLAAIVVGGLWLFAAAGAGEAGPTLAGNLLCLGSTLVFVLYLLASQRAASSVPHHVYLPLVYLWGGLLTLPLAVLRGALATAPWGDLQAWLWLLALAAVPTIVGHGSLMYGVRFYSPLVVSFFTLFEPPGATLFAYLLLAEAPRLAEIPSYVLFLGSTALFLWQNRALGPRGAAPRAPEPQPPRPEGR